MLAALWLCLSLFNTGLTRSLAFIAYISPEIKWHVSIWMKKYEATFVGGQLRLCQCWHMLNRDIYMPVDYWRMQVRMSAISHEKGIWTHTHKHTRTRTHTRTYAHARTHTDTHTCMGFQWRTHAYAHTHTHIRTDRHHRHHYHHTLVSGGYIGSRSHGQRYQIRRLKILWRQSRNTWSGLNTPLSFPGGKDWRWELL